MKTSNLVCHCGNIKEVESINNSIIDIKNEGWGVIATFDGKLLKCCPDCYKQIKQLAIQMVEMTGNKYISLSGLIDK